MTEKIKNIFKSKSSQNGSYSVGLIALVICIVIVINLIAGQLPENIRNIDISDNKIYEITDTSRKILKELDSEVTFQVFAEKDSTDERIRTFIQKYAAYSNKIKVEWIDPVLHPAELTENNVEANTILISCEDTGKSTTISFGDIVVIDEYSYYMTGTMSESEFDGEGQFTSAVNYVTSDAAKQVYYTSGHGENTFSTTVADLLDKNNMQTEELNLLMAEKIPDDCDLLFMYAPARDITEDEKEMVGEYLAAGGKVFVMLGEADTPNLDALLTEYGIEPEEGYIADMQRNYQGNYYYIFPEIGSMAEMTEGLASDMVLLINAHGLNVAEPARDTVDVSSFMETSQNAYAVTQEDEKEGTYTLGAVATESIADESSTDEDSTEAAESVADEDSAETAESVADEDSTEAEESSADEDSADEDSSDADKEARLTVISADSLIDPQVTDAFPTLENLNLFMNAVSANFEDVENVAIEPKSLAVVNNTMQHAGAISILLIFGIPLVILIFGFTCWWKRRKA